MAKRISKAFDATMDAACDGDGSLMLLLCVPMWLGYLAVVFVTELVEG